MVHALREAWRVLKPAGLLIDLRPLSVDVPLLVMTDVGWQSAGMPDQSPDRVHDLAADKSMRIVVRNGLFAGIKQRYIDVNNYWDTLKEFKEDIDESWKDEVIVSNEIWRQARSLFKAGYGKKRVRISFRKKITTYQKIPG